MLVEFMDEIIKTTADPSLDTTDILKALKTYVSLQIEYRIDLLLESNDVKNMKDFNTKKEEERITIYNEINNIFKQTNIYARQFHDSNWNDTQFIDVGKTDVYLLFDVFPADSVLKEDAASAIASMIKGTRQENAYRDRAVSILKKMGFTENANTF